MSDKPRPTTGHQSVRTTHATHGKFTAREDSLLMAEQTRIDLTSTNSGGERPRQYVSEAATSAPFAGLPGVDAKILEPPQLLPSFVSRKDAARAFAPMAHRVAAGSGG
jgi:hypothetical protein